MAHEIGDAGIKTFLIADVRGYTRFTQEQGDEAGAKLAMRFATISQEVAGAYADTAVQLRGDEALAVFGSSRQAIATAVELQNRYTALEPGSEGRPLPVGIGLDVGEAVRVEDGYRGRALNLAARLCGLAAAGEILASHEVVHLAGRIEGLAYENRGSVVVKNIDEQVRVVRIVPEGDDPADRFVAQDGSATSVRLLLVEDSVLIREAWRVCSRRRAFRS